MDDFLGGAGFDGELGCLGVSTFQDGLEQIVGHRGANFDGCGSDEVNHHRSMAGLGGRHQRGIPPAVVQVSIGAGINQGLDHGQVAVLCRQEESCLAFLLPVGMGRRGLAQSRGRRILGRDGCLAAHVEVGARLDDALDQHGLTFGGCVHQRGQAGRIDGVDIGPRGGQLLQPGPVLVAERC